MRQKKSKTIFYLLGLILIAAFGYIIFFEVPVHVEQVEEALPNPLAK